MNNTKNKLYCGDNPQIMHGMEDESVDLIYLDPPFFSGRNYEVIWNDGSEVRSFKDTEWYRVECPKCEREVVKADKFCPKCGTSLEDAKVTRKNDIWSYIDWMIPRLKEMYCILKPTGSIYLHCDWHAVHYLKVEMDRIFGMNNFQNEIIWCYKGGGMSKKRFGRKHDDILFYTKSGKYTFNFDDVREEYSESTKNRLKTVCNNKRNGIDFGAYKLNPKGKLSNDWWEVPFLAEASKERLGYPTQKPEALLERIIKASSNPGDTVFDPFCGCYDNKTELLTKNGFKFFNDISEKDEIACLEPNTKNLIYNKPLAIQKYHYNGKMYHFHGKAIDLCVTPDHNMYISKRKTWDSKRKEFILSYENYDFLKSTNVKLLDKIYRSANWKGKEENFMIFPACEVNYGNYKKEMGELSIPMEKWLNFLGMWIADGWYSTSNGKYNAGYRIGIKQITNKDFVRSILNNINVKWHENDEGSFYFSDKRIHTYLSKLNKTHDRKIPNNVKNLSKRLIRTFLESFVMGDGWKTKWGNRYITTSKILSDDIQELCLKVGQPANIYKRLPRTEKKLSNNGRVFWSSSETYTLYEYKNEDSRIKHIKTIDYNNYVYCVTVPTHVILVRRNGKIQWCGNCGTSAAVAQKSDRQYIGIDISPIACKLIANRVRYPESDIIGLPRSPEEIKVMEPHEFQNWVCQRMSARNTSPNSKTASGADGGVDGVIQAPLTSPNYHGAPIQVKRSDGVGINTIKNFFATMDDLGKDVGFIVALSFGKGAKEQVAKYKNKGKVSIHLLTVEDIINKDLSEIVSNLK